MTLLDPPARPKTSRPRRPAAVTARPVRAWDRNGHAAADRLPRYLLTVDQYHQMIKAGILEEGIPVELLDGRLEWKDRSARGEDPMTVGREHTWVVETVKDFNPRFRRLGSYVRAQQPVTFPPHHEPEPDLAIVCGDRNAYLGGHPGPADILCLIEVSDNSLTYDRTKKLRIYADAGVAMYVIINLPDRVVEVYTQPAVGKGRYATVVTLSGRDKLTFPTATGKGLTVPVKNLLPPSTPPKR
jgi:Uma2 family endonuclease